MDLKLLAIRARHWVRSRFWRLVTLHRLGRLCDNDPCESRLTWSYRFFRVPRSALLICEGCWDAAGEEYGGYTIHPRDGSPPITLYPDYDEED